MDVITKGEKSILAFFSLYLIYFIRAGSWHTNFEVFKENVPFVVWALYWSGAQHRTMHNIRFNNCIHQYIRPPLLGVVILIRLSNVSVVQNSSSGGVWVDNLTWRNVFAPGARVFNMIERMEKMMIWMVAPPAYQYGPLIPYLLATVEDWSKVADHVHWDTMVVAVRPMETLPPASKAVSRLSASW